MYILPLQKHIYKFRNSYPHPPKTYHSLEICSHLWAATGDNTRHAGAASILLSTSDCDISPCPASARRAATASDYNVVATASNGAGTDNVGDNKASDGDTSGCGAVEITSVVVLLNQNTVPVFELVLYMERKAWKNVLGNGLEGDVWVGHFVDGAGVTGWSLDSDTVHRVLDNDVGEGDGVNNVDITATDWANRDTVSTGADRVLECDGLA